MKEALAAGETSSNMVQGQDTYNQKVMKNEEQKELFEMINNNRNERLKKQNSTSRFSNYQPGTNQLRRDSEVSSNMNQSLKPVQNNQIQFPDDFVA